MSDLVEVSRDGRLLHLALNRPEKRNALNVNLCRRLAAAFDDADADPGVGAILLTAHGPVFCAGMDLTEILSIDTAEADRYQEQLFTAGTRLTGGTGLVANCHIVIAAEGATFGLTEVRLGLWPFLIFRAMTLAVGERRAVEWALTGRIVDAREAAAAGLVHHLCPAGDVVSRATKIARELAQSSLSAVREGLKFVHQVRDQDTRHATGIARSLRGPMLGSPDFHEGVRAFQQKRLPRWPSLDDQTK